MKYLKLFEDFTGEKILYLFDFDETLVETPEFEEAAIAYLNESLSIGEILDNYASRMGITPKDFKIENGKIYIDYIGQDYKQPWILKGKRLYLTAPQYHWTHSPDSLPTGTLELVELYNSVEDKAIITARPEDMRDIIVGKMKELGLEQPKWGLHMFPIRSGSGAPGQWKGDVAVSLIEESGINNVKFYDDKPKIVNRVVRTVKEKLPNIKIEGIRVRSEQLTEEVNWKKLATGAAMVGAIGLGTILSGPSDVASLEDTEVIAGKKFKQYSLSAAGESFDINESEDGIMSAEWETESGSGKDRTTTTHNCVTIPNKNITDIWYDTKMFNGVFVSGKPFAGATHLKLSDLDISDETDTYIIYSGKMFSDIDDIVVNKNHIEGEEFTISDDPLNATYIVDEIEYNIYLFGVKTMGGGKTGGAGSGASY
jgi:hypothetical protein